MQPSSGHRDFRIAHPENGLGLFKSEMQGTPIREIIALRAKVYYQGIDAADASDKIKSKLKCKGVNETASKRLTRDNFYHALYNEEIVKATTTNFGVLRNTDWQAHQAIAKKSVTKNALWSADDKRFILPNKISTTAHGHYKNEIPAYSPSSTTEAAGHRKKRNRSEEEIPAKRQKKKKAAFQSDPKAK